MRHLARYHCWFSKYLAILLMLGIPFASFGQTDPPAQQVTGVLTDAETGETLIGANVLIKGTSNGTVTDFDGNYSLQVRNGDVLVYSYTGYANQEVTYNGQPTIDIVMSAGELLEEVVVVGYSTTTKKELTGAVSVVQAEAIESLNPTRLEQALQGQTAGVQISSQSGSPGGGFNIRIRGITSNGNNNPLILVDGVRYEELSSLDPSTVESINVLKDASASIYGVQAANGVILITTKKGRVETKPTIDLHAYYGIQETARRIPTLNATEYAVIINEAHAHGGSAPPFTDISSLGEGTDWQDEVFETAPIHNINLNVRGGGARSTYAIGGSMYEQKGIVGDDKAFFRRYTANMNYTTEVLDGLKFTNILAYSNVLRRGLLENAIGSVLFNALNMDPTRTVRDANGDFTLAGGLGNEVINPLAQIENTFNRTDVDRFNGRVALAYSPIEGLELETSFNYNLSEVRFLGFSPEIFYGPGKVFNNVESSVSENSETFSSLGWDNVLNYEQTFDGGHKVKATLGSSIYEENYRGLFATGFGIPNNSFEFAALAQANEIRDGGASSGKGIFRLLSYFGRVEYGYNFKYLASFILRRDGTSRFGPDFRFGYFPSASLAWVVSEEEFLGNQDVVDFLKLRLSYGETGNDKIGDFRYLSSLTGEAEYVFNGNTLDRSGQAIGAIPNPQITWERNSQFNVGIDATFLRDRLSLTADYFIKESTDLLLGVPVSGLTGASAPGGNVPVANAGSIRNSGIEVQITYSDQLFQDFNYSVGFNMTKLKNETLELADGVSFIQSGSFGIGQLPPTRWEVGQPIGYFYGLQTDGIFQTQAELETHASQQNASVGDLRYVDINQDGVINEQDRTFIGSPIPDYVFGFNLSADFKGFDISAFAEAQVGRDLVRNYERNLPLTNKNEYYIQRWTGPNTSTTFPKVSIGANDNDLFSDFWIEDGSYLRIKNVQLGYSLPQTIIQRIGMQNFRIYASVNNLYTFTDYQGYDPNISSGSPLASGIDIGYYPQARTYILGAKATF